MSFVLDKDTRDAFEEGTDYEAVSAEQRLSAKEAQDQFEEIFLGLRSKFQEIRSRVHETDWPKTAADLAVGLQKPGGAYWKHAAGIYQRVTGAAVDETKIRRFVSLCPPFRAVLAALAVAQHDRAICDVVKGKRAGRNDVFMAVYLPYCDEFISNDHRQQIALRQVVSIAELQTSVIWYKDFKERMFVA
jgi:hypothetical protein